MITVNVNYSKNKGKNDYVGGEGGKKSPKSDYVICEHSLSVQLSFAGSEPKSPLQCEAVIGCAPCK